MILGIAINISEIAHGVVQGQGGGERCGTGHVRCQDVVGIPLLRLRRRYRLLPIAYPLSGCSPRAGRRRLGGLPHRLGRGRRGWCRRRTGMRGRTRSSSCRAAISRSGNGPSCRSRWLAAGSSGSLLAWQAKCVTAAPGRAESTAAWLASAPMSFRPPCPAAAVASSTVRVSGLYPAVPRASRRRARGAVPLGAAHGTLLAGTPRAGEQQGAERGRIGRGSAVEHRFAWPVMVSGGVQRERVEYPGR